MINTKLRAHIAVISHKRPHNVKHIQELIGECTFFVNTGEKEAYQAAGALHVYECGTNICQARNKAIYYAGLNNLPSIQVSDDLRSLKRVSISMDTSYDQQRLVLPTTFADVVTTMIEELDRTQFIYGGVAVTTNRLNYVGEDFSYDKLIVCDLVCIMPRLYEFDEAMALKEDYDMTIRQLIEVGGVVRCNQFLCDFPHRDNEGGANTYRNTESELDATKKLHTKWGNLIKKHPTRPGQIALNYFQIKLKKAGQQNLF
jgi:hypothetical protein